MSWILWKVNEDVDLVGIDVHCKEGKHRAEVVALADCFFSMFEGAL